MTLHNRNNRCRFASDLQATDTARIVPTILATTTLVRIDQVDQDLLDVLIVLGELEHGAFGRRAYVLGGQTAVQMFSFTAKLHH